MPSGESIAGVERSDMRTLSRVFDWSATAVGGAGGWPQSLRTAMNMVLDCGFPMILWWGPEMVQFYNDAYVPILQGKHPRALGQRGRECWAEVWDAIGPMLADVRTRGVSTFNEDLLLPLNRNGYLEECYFTFSYSPIRDERGGVGGTLCTVTETTAKVIGERRLRTLRDLDAHAFAAQSVPEACALAVQTLAANPADLPLVRVFAPRRSDGAYELAGESGAVPSPAGAAAVAAAVAALQRDGRTSATVELPAADAPLRRVLVQALGAVERDQPVEVLAVGLSPSLSSEGAYRSFLTVVAGQLAGAIKNARDAQHERERLARLAELDEAKTEFFNNVSHEFRTPLTLLLGPLAELAASGEVVSEPGREQLDTARRNALRLLKLVNTLLEFSRLEAGRLEGSYRATDLAEITAGLASTFRSAVEAAGLRLVVDTPPLPQPVYVDRTMWERIVLNLLSNALKFTFAGEIRVALAPTADGTAAELRVSDTGTGIPPDALPHLFERFRRVRGAKSRTHEGTGIGLALVHDLAALHGGGVAVESTVDAGSTFVVTVPFGSAHLPAELIDADDAAPAPDPVVEQFLQDARGWSREVGVPAAGAEPAPTGRPRVLVADDNADLRAYITRLLADRYDVETVADGAAALRAVERRLPDLVVTDAMMPVLDGFALLRRLRGDERSARLPVIMLSARAGQESAIEGLEGGADDYLVKPFSADELRARVEAHLKVAKLRGSGDPRELRFLMEATRVLVSSLDLETTMEHVLGIALPVLGDVCSIRLVDEHGKLKGASVTHVDARKRELARRLHRTYQDVNAGSVLAAVLHSGVAQLHPAVTLDLIEADALDAEHLRLQRELGLRSVMVVALIARDRVLGTISFGVTESDRRYDERDLAVAEEFARRAAAAIDNAQLFERERRVAQRFQEAAMPRSLPTVPGLTFSSFYAPGQSEALVGGDWYDALRLPDGRVVVSIGDVVGSGLEAAVTMGHVRQVIRGVAHIHPDPALILDAADKTLRAEYPDRLVTAFIAVLDQIGGTLTYASAGHPAPFVRERDEPAAVGAALPRGAVLLLYTDGLVEATHDYLAGEAQVRAALADPLIAASPQPAQAIYERVLPGGARDDVALLAVAVAAAEVASASDSPAGLVRSWSFDASDAASAYRARREFAAEIEARSASPDETTMSELVFGELVGNVVRHAAGSVNVILDWTGTAPVLHVIDDGPGFQHNPKLPADLLAESGRGLYLIATLTFDFQVTKRVGRGTHARTVLAVRSARNGHSLRR